MMEKNDKFGSSYFLTDKRRAYSESSQTSRMEYFAKITNFQRLIIFTKSPLQKLIVFKCTSRNRQINFRVRDSMIVNKVSIQGIIIPVILVYAYQRCFDDSKKDNYQGSLINVFRKFEDQEIVVTDFDEVFYFYGVRNKEREKGSGDFWSY